MTSEADGTSAAFGGWRGCDACGEAIAAPSDAVLAVAPEVIEERRAGIQERDRARAAGEDVPHVSTGLVPWDWVHRACAQPRPDEYVVAGDRIDTLPKAMARTLELLDREWFLETAWEDAIRRFYEIPPD
ncbi:MAG: hypothetical protein WD800_07035 [Dehalococcoidia bacterium]